MLAPARVSFLVTVVLEDLTNLPYVSGLYFAKWKLKGTRTVKGRTQKATVRENTVVWNASFQLEATIYVGKDGVLQPCDLILSINQEVNGDKSEEIGVVYVNLAEYAGAAVTTRKYLLQESRVNSIAKISVSMQLIKGDPTYRIPEAAPDGISGDVFGSIFSIDSPSLPGTQDIDTSLDRIRKPQGTDETTNFVDELFRTAKSRD
ncbi:N-terminal C2 in EEIG1 and EHBP1 proteins-domain-containing protein [Polychytrium aggregatum]|uniref:N-terminal C2 in EEIG1 and EHBP1 proteins-domain-containing protein n=1 Tax=Polychytrium aggregatum TaxID=110093 RepID=UPI0022FE6416|nr:N-terminal C2 in EEIG1 and EHBP1 proteins-domain-containing protein [Polychytrium aggregatum]KAI9209743.1 N-terminal C2 in EEIG1 and EHBP1 proteins-domain-containing protein [Polychytrium aggregatum]